MNKPTPASRPAAKARIMHITGCTTKGNAIVFIKEIKAWKTSPVAVFDLSPAACEARRELVAKAVINGSRGSLSSDGLIFQWITDELVRALGLAGKVTK